MIAAYFAYTELGFVWAISILCLGVVGAIAMFFLEVRLLSSSRLGRHFALKSTISAKLNPKADEKLVGREGVTLTVLAPSGRVEVGGKVYTASAEDGFLEKGVPIRVFRTETFNLIVARK